jgi:hypothetical protein
MSLVVPAGPGAYMGKNDWNSLFEVKGSYASSEFALRSGL